MKSLLVIAHGSRRESSNDEVRQLVKTISNQPDSGFDDVSAAFLELAEPSIPDGLEACIEQGGKEIIVFPYFLAAGRHVVEDIPAEVLPVTEKLRATEKISKKLAPTAKSRLRFNMPVIPP